MSDTVQRRKLDFRSLDDIGQDVRRLLDVGYDRAGNWSLAQVCDHLANAVRMSMDGFGDMKVPAIVRWGGRWVARPTVLWTRRMPKGVRAPKEFQFTSGMADGPAAEALLTEVARFAAHTGPLHPSPLFGVLSAEQWKQVHLIHAGHHLGFLVPKMQ